MRNNSIKIKFMVDIYCKLINSVIVEINSSLVFFAIILHLFLSKQKRLSTISFVVGCCPDFIEYRLSRKPNFFTI